MGELRIILLILGALALLAVYALSKPRKRRQARERDVLPESAGEQEPALDLGAVRSDIPEEEPQQEDLSLELERLGQFISREHHSEDSVAQDEDPDDYGAQSDSLEYSMPKRANPGAPTQPPPQRIIAIYVRARGRERITGQQLKTGADKVGLEYGHMDIFHRLDEAGHRETIFSLANMTPPGRLDRINAPEFTSPGVALFLQLPGPVSGLNGLDAMLAAGQRLSQLWNAELLDDSHCSLTRQRILQLREEVRDFDRKQTIDLARPASE